MIVVYVLHICGGMLPLLLTQCLWLIWAGYTVKEYYDSGRDPYIFSIVSFHGYLACYGFAADSVGHLMFCLMSISTMCNLLMSTLSVWHCMAVFGTAFLSYLVSHPLVTTALYIANFTITPKNALFRLVYVVYPIINVLMVSVGIAWTWQFSVMIIVHGATLFVPFSLDELSVSNAAMVGLSLCVPSGLTFVLCLTGGVFYNRIREFLTMLLSILDDTMPVEKGKKKSRRKRKGKYT